MNLTPALMTDRYELTMLSAALKDGTAHRHSVFEVFARRLPSGRRYGVAAGQGRLTELVRDFRFGEEELGFLRSAGIVDDPTADWLAGYRFTGDVDGYAEGELFFPGSPILTVSGTFAECVVLETLVLSVLNHDSAIAAAAARMVTAARGRPIIEMGGRRTLRHRRCQRLEDGVDQQRGVLAQGRDLGGERGCLVVVQQREGVRGGAGGGDAVPAAGGEVRGGRESGQVGGSGRGDGGVLVRTP